MVIRWSLGWREFSTENRGEAEEREHEDGGGRGGWELAVRLGRLLEESGWEGTENEKRQCGRSV